MIVYDVKCGSGHRFEYHAKSMFDDNPQCHECGESTARIPAGPRLLGLADSGPSRDQMPNTWHGIGKGDRDTVRGWHTLMSRREKLEEKYPELAGDRRPVLAHEGPFAGNVLRAGDAQAEKVYDAAVRSPGKSDDRAPSPTTTHIATTTSGTS